VGWVLILNKHGDGMDVRMMRIGLRRVTEPRQTLNRLMRLSL
jgi:hypothetical protein